MIQARPQHADKLDFVQINDFDEINEGEESSVFDEAVKGVDGIIHTASVRLLTPLAPSYHHDLTTALSSP